MNEANEGPEPLHIRPSNKIRIPNSQPLATSVDDFTGRIQIRRATKIPFPNNWDQIPAIHLSRGMKIEKSEDLINVVELPLYSACRMLYDAGIATTETNAHFEPGQQESKMSLGIIWDSLNADQRRIAEELVQKEPDRWQHISAEEHGDKYEALYLSWDINRNDVTPHQVRAYVDSKVKSLIGRLVVKGNR